MERRTRGWMGCLGLLVLPFLLGLSIPKNYPDTVPLYPKAEVVRAQEAKDIRVYAIDLQTKDDLARVDAYYQEHLPKSGWEVGRRDIDDTTITYLIANRSIQSRGSVSIAAGETNTIVRITLERKGAWQPK